MKFKKGCPHCEEDSFALKHPLLETENFRIVCDVHPLTEGHILIMPKAHISCVGAFSEGLFNEFEKLYHQVWQFIDQTYGNPAAFEHGVIGQTVFHSHVHFLPFKGTVEEIVPKRKVLKPLKLLNGLQDIFQKDGRYLFLALNDELWIVDISIGFPKFFRERFAQALGVPERSDWWKMQTNPNVMRKAEKNIQQLEGKWQLSFRV